MWETKAVGVLLLLGGPTFLVGAALWKPREFQQALPEALHRMAVRRRRLRWIHSWMIAGMVVTTAGLAGLWGLQGQYGDHIIASIGLIVFLLGAIPMLASLTFGLAVTPWGATQTSVTGSVPLGFEPLKRWADQMYALHMILAYMSVAILGASLLRTAVAPGWIGWTGVVLGLSCVIGFALLRGGPFSPPILVHVWPTLLGLVLLLDRIR